MKPLKDFVLIRVVKQEKEKTLASGVVLSNLREKPHTRGTVVAIGDRVTSVKEGDRIIFSPFYYEEIEEDIVAVREEEVFAIEK